MDDEDPLTRQVIAAMFEVANTVGPGFMEKVYERALLFELTDRGIRATSQVPISLFYKGRSIGDYFADIVVEDRLILELKCVDRLAREHEAQCLNYLRVSNLHTCLLANFQRPTVELKRYVL